MFADNAVLLDENEWEMQGLVSEFGTVCEKRDLKVDAYKSKVMYRMLSKVGWGKAG